MSQPSNPAAQNHRAADLASADLASADRALAAAEADHRIANNLAMISALVRLRAAALAKSEKPIAADIVANELRDAASEIDVVARLHRLLARNPHNGALNICAYVGEICEVLAGTPSFAARVNLTCSLGADCDMPRDRVLPIALIVNEVITNAAKHAHPAGVTGAVRVTCEQDSDGRLHIGVCDDGVGFPDGFDPATSGGVGFRVIRALAEQLSARHDYRSGGLGTTFSLDVPL